MLHTATILEKLLGGSNMSCQAPYEVLDAAERHHNIARVCAIIRLSAELFNRAHLLIVPSLVGNLTESKRIQSGAPFESSEPSCYISG
jgi:hypothetical protein